MALTLCAALIVGCSTTPTAPPVEVGPIPPGSFKATWKVQLNSGRYGLVENMYLLDDSLIVYTDQGVVQRITAGGGQTEWINTRIARAVDRLFPPLLVDALGRLGQVDQFYAFPKGNSFVLMSKNGEEVGVAQLDRNLTSASVVADGVIYAGIADQFGGRLVKLDPTRPAAHILERVLLKDDITARPAVFQNLIYASDLSGNVYGVTEGMQAAWDQKLFTTEINRSVTADLSVDAFGVYAAGEDGTLYVLDRIHGRIKWRYIAGHPLRKRPIPTDDFVYQPVEGVGVVALRKTEGSFNNRQPTWTAEGAIDFLSHDSRRVYLLHGDGYIVAHDKQTGEELFRSKRNDFARFARNETGARIYAATRAGEIVAIDPVTTRGEVGEFAMAPTDSALPPLAGR